MKKEVLKDREHTGRKLRYKNNRTEHYNFVGIPYTLKVVALHFKLHNQINYAERNEKNVP